MSQQLTSFGLDGKETSNISQSKIPFHSFLKTKCNFFFFNFTLTAFDEPSYFVLACPDLTTSGIKRNFVCDRRLPTSR